MHHTLKIEEPYYEVKKEGLKLFEIRNNDRGFQKGDTVSYRVRQKSGYYSDPEGFYEITYVTNFAQRENWVVFGEKQLEES